MPQTLSDMVIDEISLVDDPANEQARVLIVKAKTGKACMDKNMDGDVDDENGDTDPEEMDTEEEGKKPKARVKKATDNDSHEEFDMDIEALAKALEDAEVKLDALAKRADEAETALNEAHEIIKAKDEEIISLTASETPEDEVMKSLPESIRKRLQEAEEKARVAEEAVTKAKEEAELNDAIAKAKSYGIGEPAAVGALLVRVSKGMTTAEDAATLEAMLKAVGEAVDTSKLFKSIGSDAALDGEPEALLKAKAAEIQKSNSGMTFEQAYVQAMEQNPALYNEYISKRRAA